jgi:lipoprotein
MKNLLPFLMIAFVTISCSNEIEESYLQNDLLKEQNSNIAVTKQKETSTRVAKVSQIKTRANGDIVDDELVVVYGSDRTETAKSREDRTKECSCSKVWFATRSLCC